MRSTLLSTIGKLEQLMVKGFPFVVPKEYANLPQLKGRAEIQFTIKKADPNVCCGGGGCGVGGDVYVCMHMLFFLGCHQESRPQSMCGGGGGCLGGVGFV